MTHTSPRSAEAPMAFTGREFVAGAVAACLVFAVLMAATALGWALALGGNPVVLFAEVPAAALAAQVGLLSLVLAAAFALVLGYPAYLLHRAVRQERRTWVHLAVAAATGLLCVGIALVVIELLLAGLEDAGAMLVFSGAWAVVSTTVGWWWAYRRARRSDALIARRSTAVHLPVTGRT